MSPDRPCVSVITANYNGARHLAAAVRSVLDQSLANIELVIVDDCSTDDSLAVIAEAAAGDPRVRVFSQTQNGGPGAARNRALAEARGRWMAVFDSDDLMAPDRLEVLMARAEADWCDIVVDNLTVFSDAPGDAWKPFLTGGDYAKPRTITLADYIGSAKMYSNRPGLGYLKPMICAKTLARTGVRYREDLRIGEDYDLIVRLLAQKAKLQLEPRALYRYRKHANSISHTMRRDHIEAMMAADADFARDYPDQPAEVRHAQDARRKSLEAALAYDGVVAHLKAHDLTGGLRASLREPAVWPLLTMPVTARVKRFAARLRHPHTALKAAA